MYIHLIWGKLAPSNKLIVFNKSYLSRQSSWRNELYHLSPNKSCLPKLVHSTQVSKPVQLFRSVERVVAVSTKKYHEPFRVAVCNFHGWWFFPLENPARLQCSRCDSEHQLCKLETTQIWNRWMNTLSDISSPTIWILSMNTFFILRK